MNVVKVTTVGNSLGIIIPKEYLIRLRVQKGDKLFLLETPEGVELTPFDPDFALQMEMAEDIMHENREVLKKLAE